MSTAHVRRGTSARAKPRKAAPRGSRTPARKPTPAAMGAGRLAGYAFGAFLLAIGAVVLVALDIPSKAATSAGGAVGDAGFRVNGYEIVGLTNMERAKVDAVVAAELHKAAALGGSGKAAQPLVDVAGIRRALLQFGWVRDARVSRRLPDTLVIDVVERTPAALWQDRERLALIDSDGVVLDRVAVDKMPDLPLLLGPGANDQARQLATMMGDVPTLKPQLASAAWVGGRRWDLNFQTGETVALPEGEQASRDALKKFAKADRSSGMLGRGLKRVDLRIPGKMIVRLPKTPEPAPAAPPAQS